MTRGTLEHTHATTTKLPSDTKSSLLCFVAASTTTTIWYLLPKLTAYSSINSLAAMKLPTAISALNSPPLVAGAGTAILLGLPMLEAATGAGGVSLLALKALNVTAFGINVAAVSAPGRMDGQEQERALKQQDSSADDSKPNAVMAMRERTLVAPSGWAFAIWGPIYLGELLICGSQFATPALDSMMSGFTGPFVAANLLQSLWCAAFRPSYASHKWYKYISAGLLGGTAFSLSKAVLITSAAGTGGYALIPITMHFGWTTAATLVNFNGSLAMSNKEDPPASDSTIIAVGHSSAVLAIVLGVGITTLANLPVYGLTISWALAACASNPKLATNKKNDEPTASIFQRGAKVQKFLLTSGSILCAGSSLATWFLGI